MLITTKDDWKFKEGPDPFGDQVNCWSGYEYKYEPTNPVSSYSGKWDGTAVPDGDGDGETDEIEFTVEVGGEAAYELSIRITDPDRDPPYCINETATLKAFVKDGDTYANEPVDDIDWTVTRTGSSDDDEHQQTSTEIKLLEALPADNRVGGEYKIKAVHTHDDTGETMTDEKMIDFVEVDLDVDSDNDGTVETDDDTEDSVEEDDPGKIIAVNQNNSNGDDDNGDGTVDGSDQDCDDDQWDDDAGDLAEINLGLDPDDLPNTHKVELTVSDASKVRVFDDANPPQAILGPSAGSKKEYELSNISLPSSDQTFYVEGVAQGNVTLTLNYYKENTSVEPICSDTVTVSVVEMSLFRDKDCTKTLEDWPEVRDGSGNITKQRSPKYIFGKEDGIYIQVKGPDGLGNSMFEVGVASESGSLAPENAIALHESSAGVYKNQKTSSSRELRLGDAVEFGGDFVRIKVVDEEVLSLTLKTDAGATLRSETVMVDRGEYLMIAGSECDKPLWDIVVDDFNQNINDGKARIETKYKWWENGFLEGKQYKSDNVDASDQVYEERKKNAFQEGADGADSCSDFLFDSSHGGTGWVYFQRDVNSTLLGAAWKAGQLGSHSGWESEADFCIISACEVMGTDSAPDKYVDRFINGIFEEIPLHAALATSNTINAGALNDDFKTFIDQLKAGDTVRNAWINTCISWGLDTEYGILVRESNKNDLVQRPSNAGTSALTRDSTSGPYIYYWYKSNSKTITPSASENNVPDFPGMHGELSKKVNESVNFSGEIKLPAIAEGAQRQLTGVINLSEIEKNFDFIKKEHDSLICTRQFADLDSPQKSQGIRKNDVLNRLKQVGFRLPSDYVFSHKGEMRAKRYGGKGGEWCSGQVFRYIRRVNGYKILNDTCTAVFSGEKLNTFNIVRHSFAGQPSEKIKELEFSNNPTIPTDNLENELAFVAVKNDLIPVWTITVTPENVMFVYNARTGNPYVW